MTRAADPCRRLHDEEDADLASYLATLAPEDWDRPSLCAGWRVRDVVGHILDGNELRLWTLPFRLARYGFSSDRSGKAHSIARADGRAPEDLLRDFEQRDRWAGTCRVFPPALTLLDRLVHHQDIRRALGHQRVVPPERLEPLLPRLPRLGTVFGSKTRLRGLRIEAHEPDWAWGDPGGPLVTGPAEAVLLAALGRSHANADLTGAGVALLAERQRS